MDFYDLNNKTWNNISSVYHKKFSSLTLYNEGYDKLISCLKNDASILELGCGPAVISNYLLSKNPSYRILATDASATMLEVAKQNVPLASFMKLDLREIGTLHQKFDAVIAGFLLPYIAYADFEPFLKNIYNLLNKEGSFYLSFVEGEKEQSGIKTGSTGDTVYFNYYSSDIVNQAAIEAGFTLTDKTEVMYETASGSEVHSAVMFKKK